MILHITNDYSGSTVYKNLVKALDDLEVPQIVYNPIREANRIGKNQISFRNPNCKIIYAHILNKLDRVLYKKKINKIVKDIEAKVDLSKITFIHAHTWYSDGGVAYLLAKKHNIPFINAVRSTDLNVFYKYLIHQRSFGKKILQSSQQVVLINNASNAIMHQIDRTIDNKLKIIPNGVDSFWIENHQSKIKKSTNTLKLLYVGTFIKRKNLDKLIEAVINLSTKISVSLTVVGNGNNPFAEQVKKQIKNNASLIDYKGLITNKEELLKIYRDHHAFVLPSKSETFGLVYIEALTQGLPIVFVKEEGVDGIYEEAIGEKLSEPSVQEIENKILLLNKENEKYTIPTAKIVENHNWNLIAKKYKEIYQK